MNFVLAGFHQVLVYAPGTKPDDINTTLLLPIPGAPVTVGLIHHPTIGSFGVWIRARSAPDRRSDLLSQDRVESSASAGAEPIS